MAHLYSIFFGVAVLLLLSVLASKAAVRLGVPILLLFLAIGMLAGSEGLGGFWFDYPHVAQGVGVLALVYILYAAGFETDLREVRTQLWPAISLATVGVFISSGLIAIFVHNVLNFSWGEGVLLGAIISSTDAAAVFNVFRAKGVNLSPAVRHVIEAESGTNDPMAVFLTLSAIAFVLNPNLSLPKQVGHFVLEMTLGALVGYFGGKVFVFSLNRVRLNWQGLYPVFSIGLVLFLFACTALIGGSGFLAVYIGGLIAGSVNVIHRHSLMHFHDAIAWLLQIAMFLILGLQVFPSQLIPVARAGLGVSLVLIFLARPVSVFLALAPFPFNYREKLFISWAGLRGAAPIILATFAVTAGIPHSREIFNTVFFVSALSVAIQGTTVDKAARWLRVLASEPPVEHHVLQFDPSSLPDKQISEFRVAAGSASENSRIMDLELPRGVLILLIVRGVEDLVPSGETSLLSGDVVQVLAPNSTLHEIRTLFEDPRKVDA